MKNNNYEEIKIINNDSANIAKIKDNKKEIIRKKNLRRLLLYIILTLINLTLLLSHVFIKKKGNIPNYKECDVESRVYNYNRRIRDYDMNDIDELIKEKERPSLMEINKKRTFEKRIPLIKEINCKPHFKGIELPAFLSFLTKNTTYFETGSGCSSVMAKYYTKKSYAVEGGRDFYNEGVKHGLKENLLFRNLKPDSKIWSYPGKKSNLNDWKKYFQAYDKSYNADVILLDGRFKIATAMDIFDKINYDTIVLIHEYNRRSVYFVLENYYQYVYHWGELMAFVKKRGIESIPLEVQKKYWNTFI
jgi:hypothetical protein